LLLNARDAVGAAGQIRIATAVAGSWVRVSFADNGCGMAPEYVQHSLFKPFQTTKKKGLGIGLYQSKLIVEAHQGRIEVQSQLGKGTTFTILLPLPGTHT
jgi:signal transduction histidine kinase